MQQRGPFDSPAKLAAAFDLAELPHILATDYMETQGVSGRFVDDLVAAALRVNYGNTPDRVHAFISLISMAGEGASSVVGGNRQIFERMVAASGAELRLETAVSTLTKLDADGASRPKWLVSTADGRRDAFDAVIVAAPLQSTGIGIANSRAAMQVPLVDYVYLHVTLVVTSAPQPRGSAFGFDDDRKLPATILSTFAAADRGERKRPLINSLNCALARMSRS